MASIRKRMWRSNGGERTAWIVDYLDQAGKRRLKTFAKKKDADAFSVKARHEVLQGIHTPESASITVAELSEIESGGSQDIIDVYKRLAEALNVDIDDLV